LHIFKEEDMADPVKILSTEIPIVTTASNNVSLASLVRIINLDDANNAVIQVAYSNGSVKGTFTLGHHGTDFSQEFVVKLPTDTIQVLGAFTAPANAIRATSVAYL
jgi:hypothetical protein